MALPTVKKKDLIDLQSTFLQAIQSIPGDTYAKKHEYLIQLSNTIEKSGTGWDSVPVAFHLIINAEIAKKTGKHELIINALKSSDDTVVTHVLNIGNLFVEKNSPFLRFDYFYCEILAEVSLSTRRKIIKKIALDLTKKESQIAREFFSGVLKHFGIDTASPLLFACDEEFVQEQIMKYRIILHKGLVKKLFKRYPEVVIKYLKYGIPSKNEQPLRVPNVKIKDYLAFLPCLMSNHFDEFIEICSALSPLEKKILGKRKTREFCKKGLDEMKKNPKLFLSIVDLEAATKQIKFEDFQAVVRGLLPDNLRHFCGKEISPYLQHLSDTRKVQLIRSIFKDAYGSELYEHPYLISKNLLSIIPTEDRIKIAKSNREKDPTSYPNNENHYQYCDDLFSVDDSCIGWRCFYPVKETIPKIKTEIAENSREGARRKLVSEMFYTCKINNDNAALLDTLAYLKHRHKNESLIFFHYVLNSFVATFCTSQLDVDCCKAMVTIIGYVMTKHEHRELSFLLPVIENGIRCKLENELQIDDDIRIMLKIMIATGNYECSILQSKPAYTRICLEKFINIIGEDFQHEAKKFITPLLNSIFDFNEKHKNKQGVVPIDISNNEHMMKSIQNSLKDEELGKDTKVLLEKKFLQAFDVIFKNEPGRYNIHGKQIIKTLKENSSEIIRDWEMYYNQIVESPRILPIRFLKSIKWYKEIPIRFVERSLQDLEDGKSSSLGIIGYLLEGPEFGKVFDATIPEDLSFMGMDQKDAETLQCAIFEALRATLESTPPVPLDVFKKVVTEDFIVDAIKFFYSVAQRTAISKVVDFAEELVKIGRVSVKRHGIRLACMVLSSDEKCLFLERCLKSESHHSIHSLALLELYETFVQNPNECIYKLLETSLQNFNVDEEDIIQKISNLKHVPNLYVTSYIQTLLSMSCMDVDIYYRIIKQIDKSYKEILDEDFQLHLIKSAVFDYVLRNQYYEVDFIFDVYLSGSDFERKLSSLIDALMSFVEEHPASLEGSFEYPGRVFLRSIVRNYVKRTCRSSLKTPAITKALKNAIESVLTPQDHAESYSMLFLTENIEQANGSFKEFGKITGESMESVMVLLGREFILIFIEFLVDFLHLFKKSRNYEVDNVIVVDIVNSLLKVNTVGSCVLAAQLFLDYKKYLNEWNQIYKKLRSSQFGAVKSILSYEKGHHSFRY